ncbi:MAG: proline--tRNA ligase [Candidatus Nanohaloarchaeota archaeon QJJ-7]|nr:proline--tRNA ligase [Candidatus Nanohaloarchaeota archaeon QJJ-7]
MSGQELGVTVSKDEDMAEWYTQVVQKADMADYAPVAGCMIIEPWGMAIWERIKETFDNKIKEDGVESVYFPLFIPEKYLEKERELLEGFLPEMAWIEDTGEEQVKDKIAVRPTSESVIAPYMSDNIQSYRDLPFRINQWANVVRWEVSDTRPFLRTREFLWQEGHTSEKDSEEAMEETLRRLEQYREVLEDLMAISVIKGRKPEHDKFPGAKITTTVESLMPDRKSLQSATSHHLGTNFSEAYDITYSDENGEERLAHTTSWGLSTRVIGGLIMAHGDDQGLVLPPEIAPKQVVIVPIWQEENEEEVRGYAESVQEELEGEGFRVELDDREHRSPGYKFNEWELKGVPLRIEIGPDEAGSGELTGVHRDTGEQERFDRNEVVHHVEEDLDEMQDRLLEEQQEFQEDNVREAGSEGEIIDTIREEGGYVKANWCGQEECEEPVKDEVHAEIVMVPLEEEDIDGACAVCGEEAEEVAYFSKNY